MRIVFTLLAVTCLARAADPNLRVTGGQIQGVPVKAGGAVFKGIPFAQPPVADLRWRPPQPPKPWSGVRAAASYSAPCAQNAGGAMQPSSGEDCLYLNVWTPEWPPASRKPVMVWLHGGGNYGGTASTANFDGESLAGHGVVLVTINYRLTVFGFLAHPELTRESPHHSSGNYGLLDQIAALQWVRDNIGRLGGDPSNVTIFGQSAGAVDANVLMTSPLSKGLFHRVIAESGTVTRNPDPLTMTLTPLGALMPVRSAVLTSSSDAATLEEAEKEGEKFAAALQAPPGSALKYLRGLPPEALLKPTTAPRMSIGPANGVVVDGWVFPKSPTQVFASGQQHKVPLLIGNNARERTPTSEPKELMAAADAMYGPLAPRAFTLYAFSATAADPLYGPPGAQWVVDTLYRCPVVAQLVWHTAAGNTSYEYQFDRPVPGREAVGSTHGAEVSYVFGTLGEGRYPPVDHEISRAMQRYWTNFAKTGDPNRGAAPGLPAWPKFDTAARGFMEFTDQGPAAREGLRRPFCDLYVENTKRLTTR